MISFSGGTLNYDNVTYYGNEDYGLTYMTDSHLMKNSEWGAVTYLAHSKYGIDSDVGFNSYNNNGSYLTGCGPAGPGEDDILEEMMSLYQILIIQIIKNHINNYS